MKCKLAFITSVALILCVSLASAQTPRVVRYSGIVRAAAGAPKSGVASLTFAIYAEEEGGSPLWAETQTVTLDPNGRYGVLLGATTADGLPGELFTKGDARWLGISVDGRAESGRVPLVSVPYALKAADADTVGGKPVSAFVLANETAARSKGTRTTSTIVEPATAGTAGYIGMFTDSVNLGNSVIYQSGTNIGVGTTTPEAAFHLKASAAPGALFDVYNNSLGALPVVYRAARGTPASPMPVQTDDILGGLAVRGYAPSGFTGGKGQIMFKAAENWTDFANGTYLQFTTTPVGSTTYVERMRIDPSGNVGIGETPSSFSRLGVTAFGSNAIRGYNGAALSVGVQGGAGGTWGTGVHGFAVSGYGVYAESNTGGIGVYGRADSGTGVYAHSSTGTGLYAESNGTTIAAFTGAGGVGIGIDAPFDKLQVLGDIRVGAATTGCVKDADGTVIAGTCASDARFKQGVTPFSRSLDVVSRLQPVQFTWRADEFPDRHFGHARSFGLIAQDVEAVLPELVTTDADGYKAVKYNELPFYMLQAIKDLKAENDSLREQLKSQKDLLTQHLQMHEERLRRLEQLAAQ